MEYPIHYVCTNEEAQKSIEIARDFWVCNCGCRESAGSKCKRSKNDVCLMFVYQGGSSGSGLRQVDRDYAEALLKIARESFLVTRPFRSMEDKNITEGICFCCDDCCGYFSDYNEKCDKGKFIERTDYDNCVHCGQCVELCYFNARMMVEGKLIVDSDKCYGCGNCRYNCPTECIEMIINIVQ